MAHIKAHNVWFVLLLILPVFQAGSISEVWRIPYSGGIFHTDHLGNLYVIDTKNSITKYDRSGQKIESVNYMLYGELTQMDASNPFEIYMYYRDQQKVLFVDNQLSQRGELDLGDISNVEVSAVCRSYDNGLWVFDAGDARLVKYDKELNVRSESPAAALWTQVDWVPIAMYEDGKNVYLLDPDNGVAVFDIFAQYIRTIRVRDLQEIQVRKGKMLFWKDKCLQRIDLQLLERDTLFCEPDMDHVRWENGRIYATQGNVLQSIQL